MTDKSGQTSPHGTERSDTTETIDPVGEALRVAYARAVDEPVPNDILDLLAKLQ